MARHCNAVRMKYHEHIRISATSQLCRQCSECCYSLADILYRLANDLLTRSFVCSTAISGCRRNVRYVLFQKKTRLLGLGVGGSSYSTNHGPSLILVMTDKRMRVNQLKHEVVELMLTAEMMLRHDSDWLFCICKGIPEKRQRCSRCLGLPPCEPWLSHTTRFKALFLSAMSCAIFCSPHRSHRSFVRPLPHYLSLL